MLDRSRTVVGAWGALALVGFAVLLAGVELEWRALALLDDSSRPTAAWGARQDWLQPVLHVVETGFGTWAMTAYTVVLAIAMWLKRHRRAAILTLVVMVVTSLATTAAKVVVGRERPPWQDPDLLLSSAAYPSGHASAVTALGGIVMVLVTMLVRRGGVRRLLGVLVLLAVVAVLADRVLLGRHYLTDVVGGVLLGLGVLLVALAAYSPLPLSHAIGADPLPQAVPTTRELAVVLNPSKVEDEGQFRALVTAMAAETGWSEPRWHLTTPEDSGTGQAERAAVEGADLVVVCGGDGTVREVCAELAGTGIPVGIVPAGTGNLLARNLDVPLYIRAAVDVALTGQDRAIDMVAVAGDGIEDTHFMVMAGMGFDAAIMEGVNEDLKKRVGWLAYVVSGLKSLMFPAVKVEIAVDGAEFVTHRARTIVVGNVGHLQAGVPILPDAAIDDGLLDVVLFHPQRFWSWIPLAVRVLTRRRRSDELVHRVRGRSVVVRTAHDTPRQLDGDLIGPGRELRMDCVHGRVLVRVPR